MGSDASKNIRSEDSNPSAQRSPPVVISMVPQTQNVGQKPKKIDQSSEPNISTSSTIPGKKSKQQIQDKREATQNSKVKDDRRGLGQIKSSIGKSVK